jgi:two-component system, sensor histidine kinase and response regulator
MRRMYEREAARSSFRPGRAMRGGMLPTIDPAYVRILRDEFGDLAVQLIDLLERTSAEGLAQIDAAIAAGDDHELRRLAHRMKGGCQNLGAVSMSAACLELEAGAADPAATAAELRAALVPTLEALRAL